MKQSINFCQFTDQFNTRRPENFTYDGLRALFDYLEEYEESTGEETELDVIALCCDFSEYDSEEDALEDYDNIDTIDDLREQTTVIDVKGGGYIVQSF